MFVVIVVNVTQQSLSSLLRKRCNIIPPPPPLPPLGFVVVVVVGGGGGFRCDATAFVRMQSHGLCYSFDQLLDSIVIQSGRTVGTGEEKEKMMMMTDDLWCFF